MINPTVEQDMKAARLCGLTPTIGIYTGKVFVGGDANFTLSNPADMLATVKALGEKKGISIVRMVDDKYCGLIQPEQRWNDWLCERALPYEEAVLAALDSLEDL